MSKLRSMFEISFGTLETMNSGTSKATTIMYKQGMSWKPLKKALESLAIKNSSTIQEGYEEEAVDIDTIALDDDGRRGKGYHLSILQKIGLDLFGYVKVGYERRRGWQGELPIYLFRCPRHGLQSTYQSGFDMVLLCPECLRALKTTN